jgi:ActR/RegA family two-component response regulator
LRTNYQPLAGLSVLVVEDDYYQAEDTVRALTRAGAAITGPFSDADAALRSLEDVAPVCAIIDLNLGNGGPSFVLARKLAAQRIPLVIISGYDRSTIPQDLAQVLWLEKPIERNDVVKAVCKALETAP